LYYYKIAIFLDKSTPIRPFGKFVVHPKNLTTIYSNL